MFERGVKSKYFKLFIASRDFPHNDKIDEYRVKKKFFKIFYLNYQKILNKSRKL